MYDNNDIASQFQQSAVSPDIFVLLRQILQADSLKSVLEGLSSFPFNEDCEIITLKQYVVNDDQTSSLRSQAYWLKEGSSIESWQRTVHVEDSPAAKAWIVEGGPPMFIENIEEFAIFTGASRAFYQQQGIVSRYHILLKRNSKTLSVLTVMWRSPRAFSPADRTIIEFTSWVLAPAIENVYIQEENRELERLIDGLERKLSETGLALNALVHDLKQPLATILSSASFLDKYIDMINKDKIKEKAQNISGISLRMNDWLTSILLLSQVRSEKDGQFHSVDTKSALNNALTSIQALIQQFSPVIQVDDSLDALPDIWGKSTWLEHIWTNLLSNACKYGGTPPHIQISASIDTHKVHLIVKDNGPGIPEDKQKAIFEPFTRLNQHDSKRTGTGIGLTIVMLLVEKQQGEVGVESNADGTTFWFRLPIAT